MEVSLSRKSARVAREPLSTLTKLTAGALAGITALLVYAQAGIFGGFDPIVSAIAAVPLVAAGVILAGWRWAPLLGTLVFGLLLGLLAMIGGDIAFTLAHPGGPMFNFIVVALAVLVAGLALSVGAAVQNYRSADRHAPRWLPAALLAVAGLVVGMIVTAAIPQTGSAAGISAAALESLPAVTLDKFENGEIHVQAGETVALRLENPDGTNHTFTVDELSINALMPAGQNSLAMFKTVKPGKYTFYCTPHYDKATGEGMHGTLIVE